VNLFSRFNRFSCTLFWGVYKCI